MMKTIDLVYFNAGGGHRAAALALQEAIARQRRPWIVRLVDLARVLDPTDGFRRVTGFAPEELYNKRLQRGWTLGLAQELKLLQGLIRLMHKPMLRSLSAHWARTEPDLVVSLVPNFNRVLHHAVAQALPGVPFVTVLTDMADLPPHFWIEPGQDQTIVCGTPHALAQARQAGHAEPQLELVSGMMIKPSFYDPPPRAERARCRARLGLDPDRPTGVVMFGGQGSGQMLRIARQLADTPLLLMCGRNARLADALRQMRRPAPHVVLGFTDDVAGAMRLGDFFIGKPGPGCLSEAVHLGLPVITWRNAWTLPQERYNTQWVRERGVGLVIGGLDALPGAVHDLLGRLDEFRAATARVNNRAVFEVPEILARLLATPASFDEAEALIERSSGRAATP